MKAINTRAQHAPETTLAIHIELASHPFAKVTTNATSQPTPPQTMVPTKCRSAGQWRSSIKRLIVGINLPLSMSPITARCSNAAMRHSSRLSAVALGNDDQPSISPRDRAEPPIRIRYNNLASTAPMKLSALPKAIACMVISDDTFNLSPPSSQFRINGRRQRNGTAFSALAPS